jgi:hypothetical protein
MRQLLALIVLLTGLAAVSEPVRAAEARVESVSMVQAIAGHVQVAQIAVRLSARPENLRPGSFAADMPVHVPAAPATILKADRARE